MTDFLRTSLVALALLSQLLSGAVVLCVEGDGSLLLELPIGLCCDGADAGSGVEAPSIDSVDACGSCEDVGLSVPDRHHGDEDIDAVLDAVSSPSLVGAPLARAAEIDRPVELATGLDAFTPPLATVSVVAATIVLTC